MVGETWDNWQECVRKTHRAGPGQRDHLPDGAAVQHGLLEGAEGDRPGRAGHSAIADWPTKRAWVDYAFDELAQAGYEVSSAYTLVQGPGADASSSTATASGTGPTCSAPASPRSATSAASTCRTSIRWEEYVGAARAGASCRWAGPCRSTPRPAADPRDDPAAQDRPARSRLLPATSSARISCDEFARRLRRSWHDEGCADGRRRRRVELTPAGAAAGRPPAADVLRAASTATQPVYLMDCEPTAPTT